MCVRVCPSVQQVRRLKSQLDQRQKNGAEIPVADGDDDLLENGLDPHILDLQSEPPVPRNLICLILITFSNRPFTTESDRTLNQLF